VAIFSNCTTTEILNCLVQSPNFPIPKLWDKISKYVQ